MKDSPFGKFLPHLIAYAVFLVISFAFYSPYLLENKALGQSDNVRAYGMQGESTKVHKETGDWPLWTNSQFSGMPAFQIKGSYTGNLNRYVYKAMLLFQGIVDVPFVILLAMACCYLFLVVLGVDWRIGIIGSIAFGLSTYYCDIAEAGHSTKMVAVALVPGMFAGAVLAFRGRYLLGAVLFGILLSIEFLANHLQITYYAFLLLGILGIIEGVKAFRTNALPAFAKAAGVLIVSGLLGILSNTSLLWTTWEYSKETIRGKSELTSKADKGDGLDKGYIWEWSYGLGESMTLLVHNFMGGGASQNMKFTKTYQQLAPGQIQQMTQQGYSAEAARKSAGSQIASLFYWGDQLFVGTAIYLGAVILFFFFLGAFLVPGTAKWWLVISAFFTLSIAWGGSFFLNHFLVDYFPMFNKFRAVSMALGLTQLCVAVLAMMGLQELTRQKVSAASKRKAMYYALGITGGLSLLALFISMGGDFGNAEKDGRLPANIISMVKADRAAMMRADALRSLVFILLSAGLIWAYLHGKLKTIWLVSAIGLLVLVDSWTAAKRVIYADKYEIKKENPRERTPGPVDQQILNNEKDNPHYRVLDMSRGNPFVSVDASYFHKSLGGYHAAKLMRYQEVVEQYLSNPGKNLHIIGMLNGKYIIQDQGGTPRAIPVQEALGNAWLVDSYRIVPNADEEIAALANFQPASEALVQQQYAQALEGLNIQPDPTASIKLTSYHPDKMVYDYSAQSEQLAVFSEIYYPPSKGWNLYIDGDNTGEIIKVDYLLRGARLPAGNHTLEMRFEPRSFYLGETISMIASLLLLLGAVAGLYFYFRQNSLPDPDHLEEAAVVVEKKPVKKTVSRKKAAVAKPKTVKKKKKKGS